jgi:hypothetical protein
MPRAESQTRESESESAVTAGTFVERVDKVIAVLPDPAGYEGLEVTVIYREELDAARKRRCFFCILQGDQIKCTEVSCKTRPIPPGSG